MNDNHKSRVSLHGLTPEEALRALLAVDPREEPSEDDEASATMGKKAQSTEETDD